MRFADVELCGWQPIFVLDFLLIFVNWSYASTALLLFSSSTIIIVLIAQINSRKLMACVSVCVCAFKQIETRERSTTFRLTTSMNRMNCDYWCCAVSVHACELWKLFLSSGCGDTFFDYFLLLFCYCFAVIDFCVLCAIFGACRESSFGNSTVYNEFDLLFLRVFPNSSPFDWKCGCWQWQRRRRWWRCSIWQWWRCWRLVGVELSFWYFRWQRNIKHNRDGMDLVF